MAPTTKTTARRADSPLSSRTPDEDHINLCLDEISAFLNRQHAIALRAACTRISRSVWCADEHSFLETAANATDTDGLTKLVALTAIPHIARRMQKLLLNVSGPRGQDGLADTILSTKAVDQSWQAQLTVRWVDLDELDREAVERMAEVAIGQILINLKNAGVKSTVLIAYNKGWEGSATNIRADRLESRNCDVVLAPFVSAWKRTACPVEALEIIGDAGCADLPEDYSPAAFLELESPKPSPLISLRRLDLNLHQRDAIEPPHRVFDLLRAASDIHTLSFRYNTISIDLHADIFALLQKSITSPNIHTLTLHGLHCPAAELISMFRRMDPDKLSAVELRDVTLRSSDDGQDWSAVLGMLRTSFELEEVKLGLLCEEGGRVWSSRREVEFRAEGREDVEQCLAVVEKGMPVMMKEGRMGRGA